MKSGGQPRYKVWRNKSSLDGKSGGLFCKGLSSGRGKIVANCFNFLFSNKCDPPTNLSVSKLFKKILFLALVSISFAKYIFENRYFVPAYVLFIIFNISEISMLLNYLYFPCEYYGSQNST